MATLALPKPIRPACSEVAFRRYEAHIAQACTGSFTLDPQLLTPPLQPKSYVSAARDALLGYRTHGYPSTMIPPAYEVERIRVRALADGTVQWLNTYEDRMRERGDSNASVLIRNGLVVQVKQREQPKRTLVVREWSDRTTLAALVDGELNGFTTLVLLHPLAEIDRSVWDNLSFEPLAEGWWRVT